MAVSVFTGMAVFKDCTVLLELKTLPFKEKKKLKSAITENGGNVSYVVNKQVGGYFHFPFCMWFSGEEIILHSACCAD